MILVTGSTGLVGAQLLLDLTKEGNKVRAMHRNISSKQIVNRTFKHQPNLLSQIEWVSADIMDKSSLINIMNGIDTVYHSAAFVSFDSRDAQKVLDINISGTENIVNTCLDQNIKRFCHFSSVSALGNDKVNGLITEESVFKNSKYNSTYAISKHGAEREVWRAMAEGLNAFIVSPCIILGRGDWQTGSSALFRKVYKGFPFYTTGSNAFVDVRDVTSIAIQLMEKGINNQKYNVCAENLSYKDLFSMVANEFNKKPPYIKPPNWINNIFWRLEYVRSKISNKPPMITRETVRSAMTKKMFSNKKIKNELNHEFIPIKESVEHTCKMFLEDLKEIN